MMMGRAWEGRGGQGGRVGTEGGGVGDIAVVVGGKKGVVNCLFYVGFAVICCGVMAPTLYHYSLRVDMKNPGKYPVEQDELEVERLKSIQYRFNFSSIPRLMLRS